MKKIKAIMVSLMMLIGILVSTFSIQNAEAQNRLQKKLTSADNQCIVSSNPDNNTGRCISAGDGNGDVCTIVATQGPACSGTT